MKKEPKETLGQRLKRLRDEYDLSQADFATNIGLKGHVGISKIENGETVDPRRTTLEKIAKVYGTTIDWLLHGKGEMLPSGKIEVIPISEIEVENPWKDEAYLNLKNYVDSVVKERDNYWQMIQNFMEGKLTFLHPVKKTA